MTMSTTDGFPGDVGGPAFIPISLISDCPAFITEDTTVNFTIALPSGQNEPPLSLTFYELQSQPVALKAAEHAQPLNGDWPHAHPSDEDLPMEAIAIPTPIPVWNDGVATFALDFNSTIFGVLSSTQTVFGIIVKINQTGVSSLGMCTVPIALPIPKV